MSKGKGKYIYRRGGWPDEYIVVVVSRGVAGGARWGARHRPAPAAARHAPAATLPHATYTHTSQNIQNSTYFW